MWRCTILLPADPTPHPTPRLLRPRAQTLHINPAKTDIDSFTMEDFEVRDYAPHKKIEMKMAV